MFKENHVRIGGIHVGVPERWSAYLQLSHYQGFAPDGSEWDDWEHPATNKIVIKHQPSFHGNLEEFAAYYTEDPIDLEGTPLETRISKMTVAGKVAAEISAVTMVESGPVSEMYGMVQSARVFGMEYSRTLCFLWKERLYTVVARWGSNDPFCVRQAYEALVDSLRFHSESSSELAFHSECA
jgi:hypothetical protein